MANESLAKEFSFPGMITEFVGYNSERDKTNIAGNILVGGSLNVLKKTSGTIANRNGLKRLGDADTTQSPISSQYVWTTSRGTVLPLEVTKNTLRVRYNDAYYTLLSGVTQTRFVFDTWFSIAESKDRVLFVKGNSDIQHWSGGIALVNGSSGVITTIVATPTIAGSSYTAGDILTVAGGTGGQVRVSTVDSVTGAVTGITLYAGGSGYTSGSGIATTGGTGTGCTIEITTVASPSTNTLTKQDVTKSWQQEGFSTTTGEKKIMIDNVEYTYTGGENTPTLTGVSPSPIAITDGTIAIQSVLTETNKPTTLFNNDFIKTINNQVYVGSYTSRFVYVSSSSDFKNFTMPSPRVKGDPFFLTLDGLIKGITVRQGKPHIGYGTGSWAIVSFTEISNDNILTQAVNVDTKPVVTLAAPYGHEFIDTVGDTIVYLSLDNQVRTFGDYNNLFTAGFPSISLAISTELKNENFTGGSLKAIGEYVYLCSASSGKTYLYQIRQVPDSAGNVVAERLWHAPMTWGFTSVDEINGITYGYSNAYPQVYQVWDTDQWHDDSPTDENLAYQSIAAFGYRNAGRREGLITFDKQFTEGYITPATQLNLLINYDYLGATATNTQVVNSLTNPAYTLTSEIGTSLGDESLGDEPLGDGGNDNLDSIPKFRCITSIPYTSCFEFQPVYSSDLVDSRWEILALATNTRLEERQVPTFIINK